MPVNTQQNVSLVLKFGTASYECQVIDLTFTPPGVGASTVTQTACPGGIVSEPGSVTAGSMGGNVFTDSLDTGLTWILAQAYEANTELSYELTFFNDLGPTKGMKYTGKARVNTFQLAFSKPGVNKHTLDLEVSTADLARPAAA